MAESNEPLLLLEAGGFDVNENMPNSQNCSFSNDEPLIDTISSIISPENDSAYIETSNSSETNVDYIKTSESCSELLSNNFVDTHISMFTHETHNNTDQFDSNPKADSGIHDSENNIVESMRLIEFDGIEQNLSENSGIIISDFTHEENDNEFKDEEFHDAVQFFKDPSAFKVLENAGSSSAPSEPSLARSSLYQKFDPLHAKFFAQPSIKPNELQEITEDEIEPEPDHLKSVLVSNNQHHEEETEQNNTLTPLVEVASSELQSDASHDTNMDDVVNTDNVPDVVSNDNVPDIINNDNVPDVVNKHLSHISPRQSFGNILISFDSPVINKETLSHVESEKESDHPKIYTEEELQQTLKIQELTIQETFLKKQQELEESFSKRQQELENKLEHQKCLSNSLYALLKETVDLMHVFSDKEKQLEEKLQVAEKENLKLKEDLKASVEDIQSVETTFSDFHKRYEQCKNMLKVYTENEKSLKQQLENVNVQLHEKEEMYKALQSRTQEMLDKANIEVTNAKKAGDAQVAVLKAQLKKAELKISSLESDVKHVKIENGKLSSICDELMAKVSET